MRRSGSSSVARRISTSWRTKLQQDRVRRVVGPLLSGGEERDFSARDIEYVRDLGLVASDPPLRIANPIYAEVVPRELTVAAQEGLVQERAW